MFYEPFTYERFFLEITTEEDARRLIWHARKILFAHIVKMKGLMQ